METSSVMCDTRLLTSHRAHGGGGPPIGGWELKHTTETKQTKKLISAGEKGAREMLPVLLPAVSSRLLPSRLLSSCQLWILFLQKQNTHNERTRLEK